MKKILALVFAVVMVFSITACSSKETQDAFDVSKDAYESINRAYKLVNGFSRDIYEAWYLGINKKSDIDGTYKSSYTTYYDDSDALENFAAELSIEKSDLEKAVAKLLGEETYDAGSKTEYGDWYRLSNLRYSSFFSACVDVVSTAYKLNGIADDIKAELENARDNMKKLSDNYSDYEHYPNLKEYFTTTTGFFGFCLDPEGSFEQVVETFNGYRNDARDYYYDLNYIFEEALFPEDE